MKKLKTKKQVKKIGVKKLKTKKQVKRNNLKSKKHKSKSIKSKRPFEKILKFLGF